MRICLVFAIASILLCVGAASILNAQEAEQPVSDYEKAVSLLTAGLNRLSAGESWSYVVTEPGVDPLAFETKVVEIKKNLIVLEEKGSDGKPFETLWFFTMFKDELPAFGTYTFSSGKEIVISLGVIKDGKLIKEERAIKCAHIRVENMGMVLEYWVPEELPLPYLRKVKTVEGAQSAESISLLTPASK